MYREGRSICRASNPVRTKCCTLHDRHGPMWSNCHQVAGLSPWGRVPHWGLSVSLSCRQTGHSAVAIARLALWGEVHVAEPMHHPHPCYHGHFVHLALGNDRGGWRKTLTGFCNRASYPLDYYNLSLQRSPFGEHSQWTLISSWFLPIQRGLSTYLSPKFLCDQFSNHLPSKPLTIQPNH